MHEFSDKLIKLLKSKYSKKISIANVLTDIIPINKEAMYRMLRGEVAFTLEEAVEICRKLHVSFDVLMGLKEEDSYNFYLQGIISEDFVNLYMKLIRDIINSSNYFKEDQDSISYSVHTTLPHEFLFKYEYLPGTDINMLISNAPFNCSYLYIKGKDIEYNSIQIYSLDYLTCNNPEICEIQKRWIESLLSFSTLISVSGEFYRNEYFIAQRKIVNYKINL